MFVGEGKLSVAALVDLLQDPDPVVRIHAGLVLASIGPLARPAVPALVRLLDSPLPGERKLAAMALGELGTVASDAAEALLRVSRSTDCRLADLASWAYEEVARPVSEWEAA